MFSKKVHQTLPKEERSRGFNSKLNSLMPQSHTHSCSHPRSCRREEERKKSRERESKWGESESESGGRLICQRWKLGKGWRTRLSVCRCLWREDYSKLQSVLSDIKHSCRLESDLSHTLPYWNMSSCWRLLFFVLLFFFFCCTWPLSPQGHPVVGCFDLCYLFFLSKAWHLKVLLKDEKCSHHLAFCVKSQYHLFCPFWHISFFLESKVWRKEEVCKLLMNSFETWVKTWVKIVGCFSCQQACDQEKDRMTWPEINLPTQTCSGWF